MDRLNEKAAAVSGALTAATLYAIAGLMFWGAPGSMMGVMRSMMYYQFSENTFLFSFSGWLFGIIGGMIIGAFMGILIAVFYNFGLGLKN